MRLLFICSNLFTPCLAASPISRVVVMFHTFPSLLPAPNIVTPLRLESTQTTAHGPCAALKIGRRHPLFLFCAPSCPNRIRGHGDPHHREPHFCTRAEARLKIIFLLIRTRPPTLHRRTPSFVFAQFPIESSHPQGISQFSLAPILAVRPAGGAAASFVHLQ